MHLLVIAAFLILCNKYDFAMSSPIIGENVRFSHEGEYPFVASIKRRDPTNRQPETDHICSGVLISNKDVLTNEHCFQILGDTATEVVLGRHNLRRGRICFPAWWMSYNEWTAARHVVSQFINNDIIIIRLTEAVPEAINPATLWPLPDENLYGETVEVAAFGSTETGHVSRLMESVDMQIISRQACQNKINEFGSPGDLINEKYLCGYAVPYALLTDNNAGAAVMYRDTLVGIHKGTYPIDSACRNDQKINIFLSIAFYRQYIEDVITNFA